MERITITMYESDVDLFERRRGELEMSKSAFIRYLLSVNENKEPSFIKNKEVIGSLGDINSKLNEILINHKISPEDKLYINEKISIIQSTLIQYMKGKGTNN